MPEGTTVETDIDDDLQRSLAETGRLVASVRADQWTSLTPCPGWDVRGLVNHLVLGNLRFAGMLADPARDMKATLRSLGTRDHLGEDPAASYRASAASLVQAFSLPGVLETSFDAPLGAATGSRAA